MRKYLVSGGNTYPKARSCPNGRQHTDIKMSCLGTVACVLARTSIKMYVYNVSGGVAHIFYPSCARIDNNQQVYEAEIQVPRCNSILKTGLHECQKLRPLHLGRCTGKQILYTYIHIYTQYTFFLNGSLFMMALS
jgi:hypothetical protein